MGAREIERTGRLLEGIHGQLVATEQALEPAIAAANDIPATAKPLPSSLERGKPTPDVEQVLLDRID